MENSRQTTRESSFPTERISLVTWPKQIGANNKNCTINIKSEGIPYRKSQVNIYLRSLCYEVEDKK